jgi:CRP/FNR family cyclic AMP-dependent transcriptional regulator
MPTVRSSNTQADLSLLPRLRTVPLFAGLSDAELEALLARMRRRTYRPGVTLFVYGDEGDRLYIILSGTVQVQRETGAGHTVHLGMRGPGDHFGEMALLDEDGQRMADAVTASPCELLTLDRAGFREYLRSSPGFAQAIISLLARRLREAADQMESRRELDVTGRLAEALLQLRETEGEATSGTAVRLTKPRTHQQLAEIVGATRESVTRALDDLRAIKAIRTEGRPTFIVIMDPAILERRCVRW